MVTPIRFGGINSGTDTEGLVKAMTSATQARINSNKRKVLQLQAQQSAFREVISKLQNFQNTYFNSLNQSSWLRSTSLFGRTAATIFDSTGAQNTPTGIMVTTASGAKEGTYNVELVSKATQTVVTGDTFKSDVGIDMNKAILQNANLGDKFGLSVRAGGVIRNIQVEITSEDIIGGVGGVGGVVDMQKAVNRALLVFGTATDTSSNGGRGIVSIDADGNFTSTNASAISVTEITKMESAFQLNFDIANMESSKAEGYTKSNSFNVQIGSEMRVISFESAGAEYFEVLFNGTAYVGDLTGDALTDYLEDNDIEKAEFDKVLKIFKDMDLPVMLGSPQAASAAFNRRNLEKALEGTTLSATYNFSDGSVVLESTETFGLTAAKNNAFGIEDIYELKGVTADTSATLAHLGFDFGGADEGTININGVDITLTSNMSIHQMMSAVNASHAKVNMSYSSLTNNFTITSTDYGLDSKVDISDTFGIFERLGLETGATKSAGKNLFIKVNDQLIETTGTNYTIDGVSFIFGSTAVDGTKFSVTVGRDTSAVAGVIKNFVEDYNKLIDDVFGKLREKPDKGFYFLTEDDIAESGMSDREIERWQNKSLEGLLFNNSEISSVMSNLRMAMLTTVTGDNGSPFGIFSMVGNDGTRALQSSTTLTDYGKLVLNEEALMEALISNPDDIMRLFTAEDGLMAKLQSELDRSIRTSGDPNLRGSLIRHAGLATGQTSINNSIFDSIKRLNTVIDTLQLRYQRQQDRYWKMFSAMESQFAMLNSQSDQLTNMFTNMWG